ncbi:adenylyl-sulfate kinase [Nonomuraea sp. NEAU-A123]|uniref:adenylyl-sulfate kinase n=1 Tax=Nonomuraea sp. NEAU-A123 TaxID=2839649 RepID=UPI001BE426F3|nr:adenylyl-sulfate kinase [Nonomuraea sp. NEAU-A123]MBT2225338.1 adenylyl-sulfate kinase [Nonomuraea sp. NEAU-A123]
MRSDPLPLLWLCGPSGVGKSSVGWELFARLSQSGIKTAFLDADQISLCYPLPQSGTHRIRAQSLAAIWPHFREEGAQCMVLSGFVDSPEEVREYTDLLPDAALTVCRLRVDTVELKERFMARGWRPDLVAEAVAEAELLDLSDFADICLDTDGCTVSEVARMVRERAGGWPRTGPAAMPGGSVSRPSAPPASGPVPVLWLSGADAVGKSTVGYEVFTQIIQTGVRAAYVDLKQIGALRPAADDDPDGHRLKARNLAALWAGYGAAGARCLIVSGHADRDDTVRGYADLLFGTALTVCRLHAGPATLAERVARRGGGGGPAIPGDEMKGLDSGALHRVAERAAGEAAALERVKAGDLCVDTDGRSVREVAGEVRALLGDWPN